MTNKEAIEYLNDVRNGIHIPAPGIELPLLNDKEKEAVDLAIAALEFRGKNDNFWEEVKAAGMKGEETEIHHSGRVFRIREVAQ